ncbi:hypothetical protein [Streptomyces malaysiensis]|uniref:hypothetical protein n=1 Tax=Streptomyces malaysiensis TaxID=92644 RepID=UPI00322055D1|nr:hypothetical protein [Streptomyces malaysiensis]
MTAPGTIRTSPPAGELVAEEFDGWSPELRKEFTDNAFNHQVGSVLLSETEDLRVWGIQVPPGGRLPAHRHVLDYFWTALTDGVGIQHTDDGTTRRVRVRTLLPVGPLHARLRPRGGPLGADPARTDP